MLCIDIVGVKREITGYIFKIATRVNMLTRVW